MKATVEIRYEIVPLNDSETKVIKYSHEFPEVEYSVTKKNNKWRCNCIAGKIRGVCKHKDWVRKLVALPNNVAIVPLIDGEKLRASVLKSLTAMKNKRKVERAEKKGARV
jgi:hypothetical protein